MQRILCYAVMVMGVGSPGLRAIPNQVFGGIAQATSPLNGMDLTKTVFAAFEAGAELPGNWVLEGSVGSAEISHLLARPEVFGEQVVMLRAVRRMGELERMEVTFADAGSYFGYFDEELPEGLSKKEAQVEIARRLARKQEAFASLYAEVLEGLRKSLSGMAEREEPKVERFGKGRMLRAEVEEWRKGNLVMRLFAAEQRLVRVMVSRMDRAPRVWMDGDFVDENERDKARRLASTVRKDGNGRLWIEGLEPIPQGYRPYCGLNALAMAARHAGLHLDEDWMAVAAGFRNTGSAGGSNMVKLYHAVASEAGLSMDRQKRFDESAVKRALARGLPVIVWRRFSWERNALHDRVAAGRENLPDPQSKAEMASWPGEDAPLHASLLTGYDASRGEVFFLESWTGRDKPRRMSFAEMGATTYLCFVFGP